MFKLTIGTDKSETLIGTNGKDEIRGLGGNDLINGGGNADRMFGGLGNDRYMVSTVGDKIFENADAGIDTVVASVTRYKLASNVENLTFASNRTNTGYGNKLDNVMIGGDGSNRLVGGGGNDRLTGGTQKDYLSGGSGNDVLTGGIGADSLYGGAGNDVLDGGFGRDRMIGGRGDDIYIVINTRDIVYEARRGGIDEVRAATDYALGANIERLVLTGGAPISGTGNSGKNFLQGNTGNNRLDGAGGDDTIDGGRGNDRLRGGDGADRFVFSTAPSNAANSDLITDFSRSEKDKIWLSFEVFSDFDGTGSISQEAFLAAPGATRAREDGQFLIYNTSTGSLYYDAEGPDGRGPVEIAQLGLREHPRLTFNDFLIID